MLECNQNGVTGMLETRISDYSTKIDVWKTPHRSNTGEGWIGIFNRNDYIEILELDKEQLGLKRDASYDLYDIWTEKGIKDNESAFFEISPDDVIFIHYKLK